MTRILVVAPAWVGDMVMAQSLVARLAARHPGAAIDLVAPPFTAALGARMPGVSRTIALATAHDRFDLGLRVRLGRALHREHYDLAIVLPGSWKSALVPFFAGARRRRGYRGEMRYGLLNDVRSLDKTSLPRTVDRFVALGEGAGDVHPAVQPPVLTADSDRAAALAARFGFSPDLPILVLCPGAEYGPAKQWPARHFAAVARTALARGWQVAVVGSPRDKAVGEDIVALAGTGVRNLCGATDLLEVVDFISRAAAVVTNDSGLMHVAAALGRPLVAVYGSTSPAMTPPLSAKARIAELSLSCRPCFKRTCPLGHTNCLNQLAPERVTALLEELAA